MPNKRRGGCSTSSDRKQKSCKSSEEITGSPNLEVTLEEEFRSFTESGEDVWSEFNPGVTSNLSRSVVSLASYDGTKMHFTCTGTVVKNSQTGATILTSLELLRSNDDPSKIFETLMIKVRLPNGSIIMGCWIHYDLQCNIALVNMRYFPWIQVACINPHIPVFPHSNVVAVGRCFNSGKLLASSGIVTDEKDGGSPEELMTSTCIVTKSGIGGPLVDFRGIFIGMNLNADGKTPFVPRNKIWEILVSRRILKVGIEEGCSSTIERRTGTLLSALKGSSRVDQGVYKSCTGSGRHSGISMTKSQNKNPKSKRVSEGRKFQVYHRDICSLPHFRPLPDDEFTAHLTKKLNSRGYPLPITLEGGMRLLDTFEDEFPKNIWRTLSGELVTDISQIVVSLASFNKEKRLFACTGVILGHSNSTSILTSASLVRDSAEADEIADKLEIQVRFPNGQFAEGILQHHSFCYNLALVNVKGCKWDPSAELDIQVGARPGLKVIAIGRAFETGKLMATSGELIEKRNNLSCAALKDSTCVITKAGIGGPLIDFNGNFIGMNFYDKGQTPYLPAAEILAVLGRFDEKRPASDEVLDYPSWPVPAPEWHYPSSVFYVFEARRTKL